MGRWAQQQRRGSMARGAGSPPATIRWDGDPIWDGLLTVDVHYDATVIASHFDPHSFSVVHAGVRIYATSVVQFTTLELLYSAPGFAGIALGDACDQLYAPPELIVPQNGTIDM